MTTMFANGELMTRLASARVGDDGCVPDTSLAEDPMAAVDYRVMVDSDRTLSRLLLFDDSFSRTEAFWGALLATVVGGAAVALLLR